MMLHGWLKPKNAAKFAGVSERTLRAWLKTGLRHSRLPSGSILIKREWVDEFLQRFEAVQNRPGIVDKIVDEVTSELMQ